MTWDELVAIFTVEKWSEVNPEWPAERIFRIIPGKNSGTFDFFVEKVLNEDSKPLLEALNTNFFEGGDEIAQEIMLEPNAVGFLSYVFYQQDATTLNALAIEGVEPGFKAISNDSYLLSRPFFIYSDANIIQKKPQVAAFINFYLINVNEEIVKIGY